MPSRFCSPAAARRSICRRQLPRCCRADRHPGAGCSGVGNRALSGRDRCAPEDTLLVTVSRSGTTTETAAAIDRFRQLGGKAVWGMTCYPETPVGQETDFVLLAEAAQEESVAQTRSFSSMLLYRAGAGGRRGRRGRGSHCAACHAAGPASGANTASWRSRLGEKQALARFFFLGSGAGLRHGLRGHAEDEGDVHQPQRGLSFHGVSSWPEVVGG